MSESKVATYIVKVVTLPDEIRELIESAIGICTWDRNGWEEDEQKVLEWMKQFPKEEK